MKPTPLYPLRPSRRLMRPAPRNIQFWADLGYMLVGVVCIVVLGVMLGVSSTGN